MYKGLDLIPSTAEWWCKSAIPNTRKVEAEGSGVLGHPWLQRSSKPFWLADFYEIRYFHGKISLSYSKLSVSNEL